MLPELEAREELDDRRVRKSPRPDRPPIENVSAFEVTKVKVEALFCEWENPRKDTVNGEGH